MEQEYIDNSFQNIESIDCSANIDGEVTTLNSNLQDEKMKHTILKILTKDFKFKNFWKIKSQKWLAIAYLILFLICFYILKLNLIVENTKNFNSQNILSKKENYYCFKKYFENQMQSSSLYGMLIANRKLAPNNNEI